MEFYERNGVIIYAGDSLNLYPKWESPVVIISDGPYGVGGYRGDPPTSECLREWYKPHIGKWSEYSTPMTTLWFWNTEIGWANVHPTLAEHGWEYRNCHIWDKGIAHIAGNSNSKTLRKFPVATEVCVQYTKKAFFKTDGIQMDMQQWLRYEWERTGLPLYKTNEACGVRNAATRKYFTKDHLWYYPPPEAFEKIVEYANRYGSEDGKPYFSLDGQKPITGREWTKLRSKFYCENGITNVWQEPAVRGHERLKNEYKSIHNNQKPLKLISLCIRSSSDVGDVVWEPFGGLCSAAVSSHELKRRCYAAEINHEYFQPAVERLKNLRHLSGVKVYIIMESLFESEPERNPPDENWFGYEVYRRVREALFALPTYFRSDTSIEGILATDIFTLNAAFGATIEDQVVSTLNQMREVWDPDEKYTFYRFVRQPQTFPDVLLKRNANETGALNEEILLGIELKSWYLLAKEGEPSFRFQVTPDACANQDLIVVIPWALNNVISGYPKIFAPYVELAKYASEYRNYHWQYIRKTRSRTEIIIAESVSPYPQKSDKIADKPVYDGGNNFGRFARTGIMDRYLEIAKRESLCGIGAEHWLSFFKIFQEQRDEESINAELNRLRTLVTGTDREGDQQIIDALEKIVSGIDDLLYQRQR